MTPRLLAQALGHYALRQILRLLPLNSCHWLIFLWPAALTVQKALAFTLEQQSISGSPEHICSLVKIPEKSQLNSHF